MYTGTVGQEHLSDNDFFEGGVMLEGNGPFLLTKAPDISNAVRITSQNPFRMSVKHKPSNRMIGLNGLEDSPPRCGNCGCDLGPDHECRDLMF
jgi:hypothetical protein